MAKFEILVEKSGKTGKFTISGVIDEDVNFNPYSLAGYEMIELHLQGIKSINSCGIREWILWIGTAAGAASIQYIECPKIIVDQINMVQGFLPAQGQVNSFYVPFYCDDSGSEKSVLLTRGKEFSDKGVLQIPEVKDESGALMEMDVVEAKYFKFLKK